MLENYFFCIGCNFYIWNWKKRQLTKDIENCNKSEGVKYVENIKQSNDNWECGQRP
jgi:hypothetical protein